MSALLVILGFVAALALIVAKALAVDELKGRIQRRITASVEATIASLPNELQDTWAEEWRAELAAVISMPLNAAQFARGLRRSGRDLVVDLALAPAGMGNQVSPRASIPTRLISAWRRAEALAAVALLVVAPVAGWLLVVWLIVKHPLLSVSTAVYIGLHAWLGAHDAQALAIYALIALAVWRLVHRSSQPRNTNRSPHR